MKLNREDIKKLVVNQMLQEGILDTLKQKMFSKTGTGEQGASKNPNKKIEAVGDFLQMAQRSKELTALISQTKVGQAAGMKPEQTSQPVTEALGGDFVKQMRQAKITDADLDAFIAEMSKNATAKKMLAGLGLASQDAPQAQQGQQQTQQPQAAQAGGQQEQPAAAQPEAGVDDVIAVFKGKTKGPKGASDSLHTQLTRQFGTKVPDGGKLITAISKDLMNQLKANGLKVQESVDQIENFLLKEMINSKVNKDSLSILLREELTEDYEIAGDVLSVLMETKERVKKRHDKSVIDAGFKKEDGTPDFEAFNKAEKEWAQKTGRPKSEFAYAMKQQSGERDLKAAADVAAEKEQGEKDLQAADSLASDKEGKNIPPVEEPEQKNDSTVPQPAPETPAPAVAAPEKPKELGKIGSGDSPGTNYATNGFDDKQKKQVISSLVQKGFKQDQVAKLVNGFSDWLKNRPKGGEQQQQQMQEGAGNAQVRELISQFIKQTNFAADENLRAALADQTVKMFGNPAKPQGPVQKKEKPAEPAATASAEPTSGPQQVGALAGRQQQISKAADAAFKQITPTRPGIVNVGEVVGRKLKAIAQLNAKAGQALVPMVPKMLQAIEKFIGFALAKSGKKDSVKIVGGSKNAAALQKTLTNIKSKGIMKGPKQATQPAVQAEHLKEAIVEEIFNLLTGKYK